MLRQIALALAVSSCIAPVETGPTEGPEVVYEAPKDKPGHPAPRPPEPDLCGPSGVKGGVEIPVECYWGPPRHDDVEVSNPDPTNGVSSGHGEAVGDPVQVRRMR